MTCREQSKPPLLSPLFWCAVLSSAGVIAATALFWTIVDLLFFMAGAVMLSVWCLFLAVMVWSTIHLLRKWRERGLRAFIPLLIQVAALFIVIAVPWTSLVLDLDFKLNLHRRNKVAAMVIAGQLQPNVPHNPDVIKLPPGYRNLSKGGGEIMVERHGEETSVFFFTFRGVLDNFSGFIYSSDDRRPRDGDFHGDYFQIGRLQENWYWAAAN